MLSNRKLTLDTWAFNTCRITFTFLFLFLILISFLYRAILILFSQADASLTWYLQEKLQTISSIIPELLRQFNILSELVTIQYHIIFSRSPITHTLLYYWCLTPDVSVSCSPVQCHNVTESTTTVHYCTPALVYSWVSPPQHFLITLNYQTQERLILHWKYFSVMIPNTLF